MFALMLTLAMTGAPINANPTPNKVCPVTGLDVRNHLLHHYVTIGNRNYYVYDQAAARRLRNCPDCYVGLSAPPHPTESGK
jgi:hypothetical protein